VITGGAEFRGSSRPGDHPEARGGKPRGSPTFWAQAPGAHGPPGLGRGWGGRGLAGICLENEVE